MYIKDSIIMNYLKRFYASNLFMAMLVGLLVAMLYIGLLHVTALSVVPSQELGKTLNHGQALTVAPVEVTSFNQIADEPSDIQPATGYNMEQRTTNPQSGQVGPAYRLQRVNN